MSRVGESVGSLCGGVCLDFISFGSHQLFLSVMIGNLHIISKFEFPYKREGKYSRIAVKCRKKKDLAHI